MKASIRTSADVFTKGTDERNGRPANRIHAARRQSRAAFRFRIGSQTKQAFDFCHQIHGIIHTMPFGMNASNPWPRNFPDIRTDQYHIDISHRPLRPPTPIGSMLSSAPICSETPLGPRPRRCLVPSVSRRPPISIRRREYPSMFEPVHGSAPDIAGRASPIRLDNLVRRNDVAHLGVPEAADAVEGAIAAILAQAKVRTPDIGGNLHDPRFWVKRLPIKSATPSESCVGRREEPKQRCQVT